MKIRIISIPIFSIALALALASGSCGDSGNKKTESSDQETSAKTGSGDADAEKTGENVVAQPGTPAPEALEPGAPKKDATASGTNKAATKPETGKTAQTPQPAKTTAGQPQNDPAAPAKAVVEKEEPKASAPMQPVPKPVAESPKEVVVVAPPVKENAKTAEPVPGSWVVPAKDKNKSNTVKADAESIGMGKSLYIKHCTSCHGKTGRGDGSKAAQLDTKCGNFALASFQSQSDGSLFYKIREGRDDMPGFKKKLPDDEEIWQIVNYVRTLK